MSNPITANWTVFGNTLYLGPLGAPWVAFPGAMDDALKIAQAHNDALAALRRRAEQAEAHALALATVARPAATLLFNLGQQSDLGSDVQTAMQQTLAPLDAALAQRAGAPLLGELERSRAALLTFYNMLLDIKAALTAGAEEIDLDSYVLRVAAILRGEEAAS